MRRPTALAVAAAALLPTCGAFFLPPCHAAAGRPRTAEAGRAKAIWMTGDPRFEEKKIEDYEIPGVEVISSAPEPEAEVAGAENAEAEEVLASPPQVGEGQFMLHLANVTKPLGITIEEAPDESGLVYITSVGEKAAAAGLAEGDVLVGVSAVFGEDVWSVRGKSVDQIRSLVRCRDGPYALIQIERGHVPLTDRCNSNPEACGVFDFDTESELDYVEQWKAIYTDEYGVQPLPQQPPPPPPMRQERGEQTVGPSR